MYCTSLVWYPYHNSVRALSTLSNVESARTELWEGYQTMYESGSVTTNAMM